MPGERHSFALSLSKGGTNARIRSPFDAAQDERMPGERHSFALSLSKGAPHPLTLRRCSG